MSDFSQYLRGGNDKNNLLKYAMYVVYTLYSFIRPFDSKKAFFWLWPMAGNGKKKQYFCVSNDHLTIGSDYDIFG